MDDRKSRTTTKPTNELTTITEKAFNGEIITTVRYGVTLEARFYGKDGQRKAALYLNAVEIAACADNYSI